MKNLLYIGNNLDNKGANISAIQHLGPLLETEGCDVKYASHINHKVLRLLHMCWSCLRFAGWYDVVLIDTYSTQNFWFAFFTSQLCRLLGKPYIAILHGGNLPSRLESHPKWSKLLFSHSAYNVSPSLYLKTHFEAKGYATTYIPNAIDISQYPLQPKTHDTIRLLWLRSFSKLYNPLMAVYVLHRLKTLGHNAQLCMVGPDADGSMDVVKHLAKTLDVNIKITGKLSKPQWIALSKDYNLFINTSNYDNMPVSVIEAMALGFPIVSTRVGGLPHLITNRKEGVLVATNDADAMAAAIVTIFEDAVYRKQLSENARLKAQQFDWSQIRKHWTTILRYV